MNILYLCQLFETGLDAGSDRHHFFCKYAVSNGHRAIAITSNVDYKNACVKIKGESGTVRRVVDSVEINYVYSYANFRGNFFKRFFYYITYFFSTLWASLKLRDIDVVYAVSTPLTVGLLGYIISRLYRVKFVFEVSDVWPDAPVACGVVKNKLLIKLAHLLEIFCYNKADNIVGLTRGICDNIIAKGINPDKVSLITNGADLTLFNFENNDVNNADLRQIYGFNNNFIAMYMGAHGAYNSLNTIIETAILLRNDTRFLFVFVGNGDEKPKLQQLVDKFGLTNVSFLEPVPRKDSAALLSVADVFLLPNRKGHFFTGNLPNKLFDFLASARPIIVAGTGETSDLVVEACCGKVVEAEDSQAMAKSLLELLTMPRQERLAMGKNGREHVFRYYDRTSLSKKFIQVLTRSSKKTKSSS